VSVTEHAGGATVQAGAAFHGWRRTRAPGRRGPGRWWLVCSANDESECFRRLLDLNREAGIIHGDVLVLRAGEEP
jgi:hypothetical protein